MIKISKAIIWSCILVNFVDVALADSNITDVEIRRMESYTSYSDVNFDIPLILTEPCPSGGEFYLPSGDATQNENTQQVYSLLLAAFISKKKVSLSFKINMSPNFTSLSNNCEVRKVWVPM